MGERVFWKHGFPDSACSHVMLCPPDSVCRHVVMCLHMYVCGAATVGSKMVSK